MNRLGFRTTDDNGLSFELQIDGQPLAELVGSADRVIPYSIVGGDLPSYPLNTDPDKTDLRIVVVCSCGEYACGHTRCRVSTARGSVVLSEFDFEVSDAGRSAVFRFAEENYRSIVAEIVQLARDQRIRNRLR